MTTIRTYTTIDQSRKLVELGLDPSTADMCYPHFIKHRADTYNEVPEIAEDIDYPFEMPCWSFTALLELMPIGSHIEKKKGCYVCYVVYTKPIEASIPIEAAFEAICYLIEQGYIKVDK